MNSLPLTIIVQGALWALGLFSIATWTIIVVKTLQHVHAARADGRASAALADASTLREIAARALQAGPKARVTQAALDALADAHAFAGETPEDLWSRQDTLERQLARQIGQERRRLEHSLAWLASVGSVAPFVGLFGTVFGIIHALGAISHAASASIDVVAGPIGEALVATGIGIAVAVPAVLAYNVFVRRVKVVVARLDDHAGDLYALAQRDHFRLARDGGDDAGTTPSRAERSAAPFVRAQEVAA
ncbi:MotA/TolQ/ExbB proton channel family protein [Burkholderia stagnalis]|uniref:MotA/TolQ/ExbB proton channel family protein n=1 Tax=Burkholderia stagnalis TaxID=1503054 RepID=UPI000F5B24FF|nr:MotA/TolQ/ExbB proton channel family protein [Burkholderia stagnalis]RQQ10833.1 MotA/TolQ/ExbB proton channel family protein [Burkholderia stagnalis]RQQ37802.1 MotA/TolQ/ExbB proton channel family protein [Burkholderia stagnalis]RQY27683.1 MotA/TolQ/ExbB proton channel family protein [Burkholderia stagnalis]RQY41590.1 MotA/TolQ/ExbB proton channel family protein [Burkholderia stagnalis]RQY60858.1 MotA/TolQ/ExbB proton channel family protein [Burkholderia stagnalis]